MVIIHIARKPTEGTSAANAVKYGVGGLNINKSRIAAGQDYLTDGRWKPQYHAEAMGYMGSHQTRPWVQRAIAEGRPVKDSKPHLGGRWPANVILEHQPTCEMTGMAQVKGNAGGGLAKTSLFQHGKERITHGFADEDGLETVETWACAPGCAVHDVDVQSGDVKAGGSRKPEHGPAGQIFEHGGPCESYGDTGGASRFFKAVKK